MARRAQQPPPTPASPGRRPRSAPCRSRRDRCRLPQGVRGRRRSDGAPTADDRRDAGAHRRLALAPRDWGSTTSSIRATRGVAWSKSSIGAGPSTQRPSAEVSLDRADLNTRRRGRIIHASNPGGVAFPLAGVSRGRGANAGSRSGRRCGSGSRPAVSACRCRWWRSAVIRSTCRPCRMFPAAKLLGWIDAIGADVGRLVGRRSRAGAGPRRLLRICRYRGPSVRRIPDRMRFDQAAGFRINYVTALHGLRDRALCRPARRCW